MKMIRAIVILLLVGATAASVIGWQRAEKLRLENEALRAENENLKTQSAAANAGQSQKHAEETRRQQMQMEELARLRGEVTQLRPGAREVEKLRGENLQLRQQNQQGRAVINPATAPEPAVAPNDHFPKENWSFAGYATPESALVSAIWSMREGDPKTYLASLSPEEQQRMAKVWQDKTEAEIVAKHQQDVSVITGLRVLDRQEVSPDEMRMSVFIEGANRAEIVSMKRVGNDWKFGGYIREPKK